MNCVKTQMSECMLKIYLHLYVKVWRRLTKWCILGIRTEKLGMYAIYPLFSCNVIYFSEGRWNATILHEATLLRQCICTQYRLVCLTLVTGFLAVRLPLWPSGQSIQRSGFNSQCYQIFWEVVSLERSPPSLVSAVEELLERKSSGSGLENWD
jgi:hypothetical protein